MSNKPVALTSWLLAAMLALLTGCSSSPGTPPEGAGASTVIAVVNGRNITEDEIAAWTSHLEALAAISGQGTDGLSPQSVLQRIIDTELLTAEAERRGITVSEDEIRTLAANQRSALSEAAGEQPDWLDEYLEHRGITEDEFWQEQESLFYPNTLHLGKLRQSVSVDLKTEDIGKINEHLEDMLARLKGTADVRILDDRFK